MERDNLEISNDRDDFSKRYRSAMNRAINCVLLFLMIVFPLVYDNSFYNIGETKYMCFYLSVLCMAALVLAVFLVMAFADYSRYGGEHIKEGLKSLAPRNWRTTFHAADVAVIVFWLLCCVSTLQSEYVFEAFWGNEGRYSGLFLITIYVILYFMVSRLWKPNGVIIQAFLIGGMIVCIIGLTDYFQMDLLHFREGVSLAQAQIFISTLGNINTYTACVAMVMAAAAAMFATSRKLLSCVWYYTALVISFFAIITGCSDNAYLAIGALFVFLPFVLFRSRRGIVRYMIIIATFAAVIQCIDYINQAYADTVIGLNSLFQVLVNFSGLLYVTAALWVVAAVLYFGWYKRRSCIADDHADDGVDAHITKVWAVLVLAGFAVICFMLIDANFLGNGSRYGGLEEYLVFNDEWGTKRGYIWRKSWELYAGFPILHKLFGYGPDTFGILTMRFIHDDMVHATGQIFDSAHNEYLQFLMTVGLFGVTAYVTFLVSACARLVKSIGRNPYIIACVAAVICYVFQAMVNLNLPISTPFMWMLLSMGMAAAREQQLTFGGSDGESK